MSPAAACLEWLCGLGATKSLSKSSFTSDRDVGWTDRRIKGGGVRSFVEIEQLGSDATAQLLIRDVPQELVGATIRAFAEMMMELQEKNPANSEKYGDAGFEMLWAAISREQQALRI